MLNWNSSTPHGAHRPPAATAVVGKLFAVLDHLAAAGGQSTLADVAVATGMPKPTVHRIIKDLCAWGAVESSGGWLRLGPHLFELGQVVPQTRNLRSAAQPFMQDLYEATRETVHLGVLDGGQVVYVEKITGRTSAATPTRVGGRMPAPYTSIGKVLLAHLSPEAIDSAVRAAGPPRTSASIVTRHLLERQLTAIRDRQVAYDREEAQPGVVCVAAPVFDRTGAVVAGLSIAGPAGRFLPSRFEGAVLTAAHGIKRMLRAA
ncbi:IclR family transcriptional regulator [Streptomyces sp. NBC_00322]|uniref:IclR family transcriptional regulator n=1 Tax=Streptomyces sp. NBC_00322 TaxID=2975712 RepID=UPI003FA6A8B2